MAHFPVALDAVIWVSPITGGHNAIDRSGAVFRSEGSPLNPKDLLQIYVILAVGACVLCQFKVCCDVC